MSKQKKGLGKGLGALFFEPVSNSLKEITNSDHSEQSKKQANFGPIKFDNQKEQELKPDLDLKSSQEHWVLDLKIEDVKPNENQPRKNFDLNLLTELSDSIAKHGVLQPILVKKLAKESAQDNQDDSIASTKTGEYEIVAGERRWRAAQMAGLTKIPAIVKDFEEQQTMEVALIENLQRSDLNIVEEALGYRFLIEEYGVSQEFIASRIGKSRPAIANTLRLLNLPESVLELLKNNQISAGHARALLALSDKEKIEKKAREIAQKNLSVRAVEKWLQTEKNKKNSSTFKRVGENRNDKNDSLDYERLERELTSGLKRKVKITDKNISISYENRQDLMELICKFKKLINLGK